MGMVVTCNAEESAAARLDRAASVKAEKSGTFGHPGSIRPPPGLKLSTADGIDQSVDARIGRLATLVVSKVPQCPFFVAKRQIRHTQSIRGAGNAQGKAFFKVPERVLGFANPGKKGSIHVVRSRVPSAISPHVAEGFKSPAGSEAENRRSLRPR